MLCGIYEKEQEWDAIERVTTQALDVDGLDEDLHYWRIKSQIGAQNYEQALQYYDYGKKLFYDHLGIRDVERFHEIYNDILSLSTNQMSDISSLVDSVTEKEEPREVFVCEYPVFREIYRVEARRIRRTGIAEYMLLITMKSSSTSKSDDRASKNGYGSVCRSLRIYLKGRCAPETWLHSTAIRSMSCSFRPATMNRPGL